MSDLYIDGQLLYWKGRLLAACPDNATARTLLGLLSSGAHADTVVTRALAHLGKARDSTSPAVAREWVELAIAELSAIVTD